ncbi:MAG: 3-phosphoshikimate 1-carboxyvinyltransferase [Sphingomonadales bacterium]
MNVTIQPGALKGTVQVPASKSVMQRACAAALIRKGETILYGPGNSADDEAALSVIASLGATVQRQDGRIVISSRGVSASTPVQIHCGESGLGLRMFTPLAACLAVPVTLEGSGSLLTRPMHFFDEVLPKLGVRVCTTEGRLPIGVQGPLVPATICIDGALSSQFLTGLLLAYSASGASDVSIEVKGLVSKPYIDLTLAVIKAFGLPCPENHAYEVFYFPAKAAVDATRNVITENTISYRVESDWSSASFLIVAAALTGPIRLQGLSQQSFQSDRSLLQAIDAANVTYAIDAKGMIVHPSAISAFVFDANDCPDLFPPLVALAAFADGESIIKGTHRLIHKESNRAKTLQQEFVKMGLDITERDDALVIKGKGSLQGACVSSCNDHRIAMALAVAALRANGSTTIEHAEAIKKSYPTFFADLSMLGASVSLPDFN